MDYQKDQREPRIAPFQSNFHVSKRQVPGYHPFQPTVSFRPVNTGTSRPGYLKWTFLNCIFTPPALSSGIVGASKVLGFDFDLRLRILFAEAVACAMSVLLSDQPSSIGLLSLVLLGAKLLHWPAA